MSTRQVVYRFRKMCTKHPGHFRYERINSCKHKSKILSFDYPYYALQWRPNNGLDEHVVKQEARHIFQHIGFNKDHIFQSSNNRDGLVVFIEDYNPQPTKTPNIPKPSRKKSAPPQSKTPQIIAPIPIKSIKKSNKNVPSRPKSSFN